MGRLINTKRVIENLIPENAGKLLIFCEGSTEVNYLNYFGTYISYNCRKKYSNIVIKPINTEGNAMRVYNYAEEFLSTGNNSSKYLYYEKHLVFDCDAPNNIQEVICLMQSSPNEYILNYSCLLFETWLVMHFNEIEAGTKYKKSGDSPFVVGNTYLPPNKAHAFIPRST